MAKTHGKNLEAVQQMNRALILRLLQRNKVCARSQLSAQSGLKQPTITNIINDFLDWGIAEEAGFLEGQKGRRSIAVTLERKHHCVVAVRMTRRYFLCGLVNFVGDKITEPYLEQTDGQAPEITLRHIREAIERIRSTEGTSVGAVGVAVPGPYFNKIGKMGMVSDWPGWQDVAIREKIQNDLNIPVIVEHDANAGVLAECSFGAIQDPDDTVVYVAVGQGIGAGISYHGRVIRGAQGIAGEIGHTSINADGAACECGNRGCLTHYASSDAFLQFAKEECERPGLHSRLSGDFDLSGLMDALQKNDPAAEAAFARVVHYLSTGIINLIYAYNPHTLIIGDEMSNAGDRLVDAIREEIRVVRPSALTADLDLRLSKCRPDAAYFGAGAIAINHLFEHAELLQNSAPPPGKRRRSPGRIVCLCRSGSVVRATAEAKRPLSGTIPEAVFLR